ncbi:MAG: NAD-specific glutamate dehydrogenase [Chloroflexi bacterium]|nr:NAD-specific glutamate dehydrogenase [Chloroflexota bacterium]
MGAEKEIFGYADEFGPQKVMYFYSPKLDLRGILVVDNTALGPAIGGIRMVPDLTTEEVIRLARAMTLKNSIAGIPHGGAKGGIIGDPMAPNKAEIIRAYAEFLRPHQDYIPGPDMGLNEHSMVIIRRQTGRAIGLPRELGGIPLNEIGSTGFGVAEAAEMAAGYINLDLTRATGAIEGFGAVGTAAFRFLTGKGVRVVAVSDINGGIYNPEGLKFDGLVEVDPQTGRMTKLWNRNYKDGQLLSGAELFKLDVDILVPGARPDVITMGNVRDINARMIVPGANIAVTLEAEKYLADKGILVVPDFVANAGGVITGVVEWKRGTEEEAFQTIKEKIRQNVKAVLDLSYKEKIYPREAAERLAKERVREAMRARRRT